MAKRLELVGEIFGRLKVLASAGTSKSHTSLWLCRCDCGSERVFDSINLRKGDTKSCGCFNIEILTKHGQTKNGQTPEYRAWRDMLTRCTNINSKSYSNYGGRGIDVCPEWKSFKYFFRCMGERPTDKHTLERINNEDGYFPGNCTWATRAEQNRNKRGVLNYGK